MHYVGEYSIASVFFLVVTAIHYNNQRRIEGQRTVLYQALFYLAGISLVSDVLFSVVNNFEVFISGYTGQTAAQTAASVLSVIADAAALGYAAVLFLYFLAVVGKFRSTRKSTRASVFIPAVAAAAFRIAACIPSLNRLDAIAKICVPVVLAAYFIACVALTKVAGKALASGKRRVVYVSSAILLAGLALQLIFPEHRVAGFSMTVALALIFYVLQPPNEHIDTLTKLFNKDALPALLGDLYERGQDFTVHVLKLDSIQLINYTLGVDRGDRMLTGFSEALQSRFPGSPIARIGGNTFAVIEGVHHENYTTAELSKILEELSSGENESAGGSHSSMLVAIPSIECGGTSQMLDIIEHVYVNEMHQERSNVFIVDSDYVEHCEVLKATENALDKVITDNSVVVYYQPIHDCAGRLVGLEALCRIEDPLMTKLSPEIYIPIAEENGAIHRIGQQILEKVCKFIKDYNVESWGLHHIGINLSVAQCVTNDLAENIIRTVDSYHVSHKLISFEITETAAASSLPAVKRNMEKLRAEGFAFLLDDFGSGYANFDYIAALPFSCIKIDKTILWEANKGRRQLAFIYGINDLIHRLGLKSLCEGAENEEHINLLRSMKIDMIQGYYYSKPLTGGQLADYRGRLTKL